MKKQAMILFTMLATTLTLFAEQKWPYSANISGNQITIYQPQPDQLQEGILSGRAAISVVPAGQTNAIYGVLQLEASAVSDATTQTVALKNLHIPHLSIPELSRPQQLQLTTELNREISAWNLKIPQDALNASLQLAGTTSDQPLEKQMPRTGTVPRNAQLDVTYEGAPRFEPVAQTRLSYAVNTPYQVLQSDNRYYCADHGVWYAAANPQGPWTPTEQIPDEVLNIPASHPLHNTRFLYVGDHTNNEISYGFYPGYLRGAMRGNRLGGWNLDYESPDYSIQIDPMRGSLYFREKSSNQSKKSNKNWEWNSSKFPSFD